jgi:hypothetical protein
MARSHTTWRRALAGLGGLALVAGCGGGGSDSGVPPISGDLIVGGLPTVAKLNTPLGLAGSRGSGPDVFVSFLLKDKEFNDSDIQLEYGWDKNGLDGITDGTDGRARGPWAWTPPRPAPTTSSSGTPPPTCPAPAT